MKPFLSFLFSLLFTHFLPAQTTDNFSDGNFNENPTWQGNNTHFIVNADLQLQLNAPEAGISKLFLPAGNPENAVWETWFQLDFAPSNANQLRIYVYSDSEEFELGSGYFLEIGETGSNDAIHFFRQDASNATLLASATMAAIANEPAIARLRLTKTGGGQWGLEVDYTGGTNFNLEFSVIDDTYSDGNGFFGFFSSYTATRTDKFFFDDVSIPEPLPDLEAPILQNVIPINASSLEVFFDEAIDPITASNPNNFDLNNGIGTPTTATLDGINPTLVHLTLSTPLINQTNYILTASNLTDLSGNVASSQSINFDFLQPEPAQVFDILIHEIMADPSPTVGLPEAEFVELYNRSDKVIQLGGFQFSSGASPQTLPSFLLLPDSFVLICDEDQVIFFEDFGAVLPVPSFPALTNSGDEIVLTDATGIVIHELNYTNKWYQDETKDDGGWTLEMVNPSHFCKGSDNWRASIHALGGTPALSNSIFDATPDTTSPQVKTLSPTASNVLEIQFSEVMDANVTLTTNYTIMPDAGNLVAIETNDFKTVQFFFDNDFQDQTTYTLTFSPDIQDCLGNMLATTAQTFTYYIGQEAEGFDILINEVFANPTNSPGLPQFEFIEFFNRSDKVIDLEAFQFSVGSTVISLPNYFLLPQQYVIVCEASISDLFTTFGEVIGVTGFPQLPNSGTTLMLNDEFGNLIHFVPYSENWYQDVSKQAGGWSLELINPNQICENVDNWRAAQHLLGGTPGRENSVFENSPDNKKPSLIRAFVSAENPKEVQLFFSEALEEASAEALENYSINPSANIQLAILELPERNSIRLLLDTPLEVGVIYEITVSTSLKDCNENGTGLSNRINFGVPQLIDFQDIIVNEILFNPAVGGSDFLELYNRTGKIFNLSDLTIGNLQEGLDTITTNISNDFLFFPQQYIVLTKNTSDIHTRYEVQQPNALLQNDLPAFADDIGNVTLFTTQNAEAFLIDAFDYSENLHHALLDVVDGVSLERVNPDSPSENPGNWHSAAAAVGFATPTFQNSQFIANQENETEFITLPHITFSPDGDGFQDFLQINYQVDSPGYTANAKIFDAAGRLVKNLIVNELLATEGSFKWDGSTNEGRKARIGAYILWLEIFTPTGKIKEVKKTCVLAGQF